MKWQVILLSRCLNSNKIYGWPTKFDLAGYALNPEALSQAAISRHNTIQLLKVLSHMMRCGALRCLAVPRGTARHRNAPRSV